MATLVASGDINPSRFVTISGEHQVAESNTGDAPYGVSSEATKLAPTGDGVSTLAAASGDPLHVYADGDECLLEAGEAITAGNWLKPDSQGRGIVIDNTASDPIGARALEDAGAAGEKIKVRVTTHPGE